MWPIKRFEPTRTASYFIRPFGTYTALPTQLTQYGGGPFYTATGDYSTATATTDADADRSAAAIYPGYTHPPDRGGELRPGLGRAATAGIAVSAVVVGLLVALLVFFCLRRRRRQREQRQQHEDLYMRKEGPEESQSQQTLSPQGQGPQGPTGPMGPLGSLGPLGIQQPQRTLQLQRHRAVGGDADGDDLVALTKTRGSSLMSVPDDPPSYEEAAESSDPQRRNAALAMGAVSNGFHRYSFHPSPDVEAKSSMLHDTDGVGVSR